MVKLLLSYGKTINSTEMFMSVVIFVSKNYHVEYMDN